MTQSRGARRPGDGTPTGSLQGAVAVVTGAARGIGAATAARLLAAGARVAGLDREFGAEAAPGMLQVPCDITDRASVTTAFATVAENLGPVQVLVNNAGVNANFDPVAMTDDDWDHFFAVDLRGAWLCCQQVLPAMQQAGSGAIVNITSIHATLTYEGYFPYAAAKSGLEGLTRSLALEVGKFGIRVNAVAPGYTNTRLVEKWLAEQAATGGPSAESLSAQHALRRIVEPAEVAEAVCFLAGPAASAITGTTLAVDCGLSARFAS